MVGNTWAQESETVACSHGTWEAGSLGLVVLFDMNFNCFLQPTCSGKSDHLKPPAYKIVPKERIIYLKIAFNGFSTQTVSPSQKRPSIYAFPFSYSFLVSVLVLPQSLYLCHTFVIISKSCDHLNILYIVFSLYYQCEVLEHSNIYYVSHLFNLNYYQSYSRPYSVENLSIFLVLLLKWSEIPPDATFFLLSGFQTNPAPRQKARLHCFKCPGNFVLLVK